MSVDTGEKASSPPYFVRAACHHVLEMGEVSFAHAAHLAAPAAPTATAAGASGIWTALEDLDAQELRLYALGWGDHLPSEVLDRIEELRRRKLTLEAELELDVDRVG